MKNYRVHKIRFSVVRESGAPDPRLIETPRAVFDIVRESALIPDDGKEHFGVLLLNSQNRLIGYHEVSVGSLSATTVHPREVFGPALRMIGVASLVLVHNHPSGDPSQSREDERLTKQLFDAGKLLDLPVHDHVIIGHVVGEARFVSLAERGVIT